MSQALRKAVVIALLPLLLAGCGVRGSLDAPESAKQKGTATSPDAADNGPNSAAPPKPHRDFLLDPLLR
ncbi:MAG TPA: lipoprotein [Hyphomicrobiaceae bacterium]|nr:lipoprotein [Hyphomicrobiaceae bacterium]